MSNTPTREFAGLADELRAAIDKALCDAEQRGRDAELAEVVVWLKSLGPTGRGFAEDLASCKHRAKGGK